MTEFASKQSEVILFSIFGICEEIICNPIFWYIGILLFLDPFFSLI